MAEELSVTRTVFRVGDFLSWQRHGALDLRPPFQRGNVWSKKSKSYLIDTMLRGYPVPLIILQDQTHPETLEPMRRVVDGQQRLRTVLGFIDIDSLADATDVDDFTISRAHDRDFAGFSFKRLPSELRQRILSFEFSVDVLPVETPSKVLLEIFARLNRTGSKLNDQESRNAEFSGEFKQLMYDISYEQLERWDDWKVFNQQQIAQMRDVELTSELTLYMLYGLTNKSQKAISDTYAKFEEDYPHEEITRQRINHVLDKLDEVFSEDLNEIFLEDLGDTPYRTQGWFYVLFGVIYDLMFGDRISDPKRKRPRSVNAQAMRSHLTERAGVLRAGELDQDLLKALRGAATDKASREERYAFLREGL